MATLLETTSEQSGRVRLPGLETLLTAATLAPSGDNMQPWSFAVDEDSPAITVSVDPSRDTSPMNAGQRMARIAVGAAVENIVRTATYNGWRATTENATDGNGVRVEIEGDLDCRGAIDPVIERRVTNRRFYDARPLPDEVLATLQRATPTMEGVATHWITDRGELAALAELIGQTDALMFGDRAMRAAFLANVRFDLKPGEPAEEGLPIGALELSRLDEAALRLMPYIPDRLLKLGGAMRQLGRRAHALVDSSSGACLIVAQAATVESDFAVGRLMQSAWLALEAQRLAAQPMMSWPVIDNRLSRGLLSGEREGLDGAAHLRLADRLPIQLRSIEGKLRAILRFGYADPPTIRARRQTFRFALAGGLNS